VILRAVLDTSAIRAYSTGSIAVGELIGEFSDEGVRFGIPALCLIEAATDTDDHAAAILAVLTEHPDAEWLPLDHHDWLRVAAGAHLLGSVARACAALPVVHRQADYLVTAEPHNYPGIRTIDL
jgi:hypothetical protein